MKFTVSSADLLRALSTVSGAVPNKSTLPILECVLFERDGATRSASRRRTSRSRSSRRSPSRSRSNGTDAKQRIAVPAKRLTRHAPRAPRPARHRRHRRRVQRRADDGPGPLQDGRLRRGRLPGPSRASRTLRRSRPTGAARQAAPSTRPASRPRKDALRPAMMGVLFQIRPERSTRRRDGRPPARAAHRRRDHGGPADRVHRPGEGALAGGQGGRRRRHVHDPRRRRLRRVRLR